MPNTLTHSLTPKELAQRWRKRPAFVRGLIKAGQLSAFNVGGSVRISPEVITQAETQTLAVKAKKTRRREVIPREVAELLEG